MSLTVVEVPYVAANSAARGGATGRMIASYDRARTPVGSIEVWPRSVKSVVEPMLGSRLPVYIAWRPDCISLYNDSSILILGEKPKVQTEASSTDLAPARPWGRVQSGSS